VKFVDDANQTCLSYCGDVWPVKRLVVVLRVNTGNSLRHSWLYDAIGIDGQRSVQTQRGVVGMLVYMKYERWSSRNAKSKLRSSTRLVYAWIVVP
jgi:hypothetical protein